jgi:GTP cyclohydrolase I
MDIEKIEQLWEILLAEIGDDPYREGLVDTPKRVAKMYSEVFAAYRVAPPPVTVFKNKRPGGLIIDKGYFFSYCEHHVVPFFGSFHFGYIADELIVGASKIARVVDHFSAKLQIAEDLCAEVVDFLEEALQPKGSILLMSGRHLCKEMRGVKKYDSPFEVIEARGILLANKDGCKDEFMARIGSRI